MMEYEQQQQVALRAIEKSSAIIEANFDHVNTIKTKNEYKEVVTDLDYKAEKSIIEILNADFPDYNIYSEESPDAEQGSPYTWVIDPLDGTANLALGLPIIAISLTLLKNKQVVFGVVHHVIRKRSYTAIIGQGSYMNGLKLQVSAIDNIENAQIGHIVSYEEKYKPRALNLVTSLRSKCRRLLDTWAPSIEWTLLAQGKLDGLISLGSDIYDRLAGSLIVEEAGGIITDFNGNSVDKFRDNYVVASNNTHLHQQILDVVSQHY